MQYLGHTYAKTLFLFHLGFRFNWTPCIFLAPLARWLFCNYVYPMNNGISLLWVCLEKETNNKITLNSVVLLTLVTFWCFLTIKTTQIFPDEYVFHFGNFDVCLYLSAQFLGFSVNSLHIKEVDNCLVLAWFQTIELIFGGKWTSYLTSLLP